MIDELARRLEEARVHRTPIDPITSSHPGTDAETAYRIQQAWVRLQLDKGDQVTGCKIGLTSRAMQEQLGVSEPDFGTLLRGLEVPLERGVGTVSVDRLIQPRAEGEIAFLMGEPLQGPGVSAADVFRATHAVAAAIEVVDSRIRDWKIRLVDTVADNASCGVYALGPWVTRWQDLDLPLAGMVLHLDGEVAITGAGAAALGHPATCVAWLANKLGTMGQRLEPGDVVLSGSLGRAVPVRAGNTVRVDVGGLGAVTLRFAGGT